MTQERILKLALSQAYENYAHISKSAVMSGQMNDYFKKQSDEAFKEIMELEAMLEEEEKGEEE